MVSDIMRVLGLGGSNHDFSACIVQDGEVLNMIEDERITRKKYGMGLGISLAKGFSRKYCLQQLHLTMEDIDLVVGNDILSKVMYKRIDKPVTLINHHLAHAASAFYPSDFEESAILVVDAVGSKEIVGGQKLYESVTYAYGNDRAIYFLEKVNGINLDGTDYIENSLGIFYAVVTEVIGFGEHEEGKTMGLAPYGTEKYYSEMKEHVRLTGNGKIEITAEDIKKLLEYKTYISQIKDKEKQFQVKADLAYAAQQILEETILYLAEHLYQLTKCRNLCIAGGVGLNSVANYKLYKKGIFKNIFIQPAAGDNGTSIGSALYGYYGILNQKRIENKNKWKIHS